VAGPISDNGAGELLIGESLQLASNSGNSEIDALSLGAGVTVDLNGNNFTVSNLYNTSQATILNNNAFSGSTLTFAGSSSNEFDGNITNGTPPVVAGVQPAPVIASNYRVALHVTGGQWTLNNGANTYTGGTIIDTGAELFAAASSSLPPSEPIANSGLLTINNGVTSTVGQITDPSATGTLNISGTLQLAPNSGQSVQSALNISSGAALDLTNNSFVVKYGSASSPLSTIQSYLTDGFNAGWAGGEIQSSSVASLNASQSALIYSVGYADGADGITNVPSGEIEILPTLAGDAKMQGNVVFGDFQLLSQYFGQSGTTWDEGDFTYNGTTNFGDFQLLSQNFGQTAGALTGGEIASINSFAAQFGEAYVSNGSGYSLVSVPEPASAALIGLCSLSLLGRRKRKA
jgi:autotransporter-associated beta strand protein